MLQLCEELSYIQVCSCVEEAEFLQDLGLFTAKLQSGFLHIWVLVSRRKNRVLKLWYGKRRSPSIFRLSIWSLTLLRPDISLEIRLTGIRGGSSAHIGRHGGVSEAREEDSRAFQTR